MKESVYSLLRGRFLIGDNSFKNWRIILFISVLAIIMIASSHRVDKKVHVIAQLTNEVKELRSVFVNQRSKLMHLKMESTITSKVAIKGIYTAKTPPKKIRVKSQNK